MDEKIDKAIEKVVSLIGANPQPDFALKYTQAALNLGHLKAQLEAIAEARHRSKTKGAGS